MELSIRRSPWMIISVVVALAIAMVPLIAKQATAQPVVTIMQIQGAAQLSPFEGVNVTTTGVVTAVAFNGYYVQDPVGDGNDHVGRHLRLPVRGDSQHRGHCDADRYGDRERGGRLCYRQPVDDADVVPAWWSYVRQSDAGSGGHRHQRAASRPRCVISPDELPVNLQHRLPGGGGSTFDPDNDGIDFYESLEGMLVTVEKPVAVSAPAPSAPSAASCSRCPMTAPTSRRRCPQRPRRHRSAARPGQLWATRTRSGCRSSSTGRFPVVPRAGDHGRRHARRRDRRRGLQLRQLRGQRHRTR